MKAEQFVIGVVVDLVEELWRNKRWWREQALNLSNFISCSLDRARTRGSMPRGARVAVDVRMLQ